MKKKICTQCGKEINVKKSEYDKHKNHFCSRECMGKYSSINITKENNPNFAEDMKIIEKLSSISIENNAEKTGNAFKKFLERLNELNNGEK